MGLMDALRNLFAAGKEPAGKAAQPVDYNGYQITPAPERQASGWNTAGVISKTFPDGVKEHRFIRVDTHMSDGALIPPHYDSLMAKLIARGEDRPAALQALVSALDALQVEGVRTNRDTLRHILTHPDFAIGAVHTRWLETAA